MSREQEIRERLEAATPGPWAIWEDLKDGGFVHVGNDEGVIPEGEIATAEDVEANPTAKCYLSEDADLIANAPADLAYLLEQLSEAQRIARVNDGLYRSAEAELARLKGEK